MTVRTSLNRLARRSAIVLSAGVMLLALTHCVTPAGQQQQQLGSARERELTVGTVQREIRRGMAGADVIQSLGSPNIVTKDADGRETWVWDKIATEATRSESSSGVFLILGVVSNRESASSVTQRTLTVVIKFKNDVVDDFSYHASKF